MSTVKFNRIANLVVSSSELIPSKASLTASVGPAPKIIYDKDIGMLARSAPRVMQSVRPISGITVPPGKKPTLEEFDPLNPGGWQLGVGGKILPRLPEGTRVGKLVMGKYGLYSPSQRRRTEEFVAGLEAGKKSEEATPVHARWTFVARILSYCCLAIGIWNLASLTRGRPLWPFQDFKRPGSV